MKKFLPLLLSILSLLAYAGFVYRQSLAENGGELVYGLDDAYIHMAMAKNFALHGVWGVTKFGFSSSTSSILWTLMLAGLFKVLGVVSLVPYILNILFAALALLLADAMLRGPIPSALYRFLTLVAFLLLTPFPPLITGGMEHTLQIFIMLGFAWASARALSAGHARPFTGASLLMFLSGFFVAFARYDSAFFALVVCGLLFLRRRWFQSIALGLVVLIPVVVYGWFSVRHGWYFFPNSILLKSGVLNAGATDFLASAFSREGFFYWALFRNPHLLFLLVLALVAYALRAASVGVWDERQILLLLFVLATILHMQFAQSGWFFRYEAYLMAVGLVAVAAALADFAPLVREASTAGTPALARALSIFSLALVLIIPSFDRGLMAWVRAPQAMNDRYLEHLIPSQFIRRYYPDATIMANDIGAPCFFTEARILDIYGLGNVEPAHFRRELDGYGVGDLREWSLREGASIAIVQLGWGVITGLIPGEWVLVGVWEVPRNVVFGDKKVGWYATSEAEAERLAAALAEFSPEVPPSVEQRGRYRGDTEPEDLTLPAAEEESPQRR